MKKEVKKVKINEIDFKNFNFDTIRGLFAQYKEIINYLFFGVLATVVNFICYVIFARVFRIEEVASNMLSWFFSVLFAYITNKIFVFESKTDTFKKFIMEMGSFFLARVVSGILCDVGTFALMVKVLHINDIVSKVVTQVAVVIVNYIFSKFIIFKKDKKEG